MFSGKTIFFHQCSLASDLSAHARIQFPQYQNLSEPEVITNSAVKHASLIRKSVYDSNNQNILLQKFYAYGFRGQVYDLIDEYLKD